MSRNDVIEKAHSIAVFAHEGQTRKGSSEPYVTHPKAVANIVRRQGASDEVIAAALLHDVLEDVPGDRYSRNDMLNDFGENIVILVDGVSEIKIDKQGNKIPWIDRKTAYIHNLRNKTDETALISLADKIHNLGTFLDDFSVQGDALLEKFNSTPKQQLWYYETLLETVFIPRFGVEHILVTQLRELLGRFVQMFHLEYGANNS